MSARARQAFALAFAFGSAGISLLCLLTITAILADNSLGSVTSNIPPGYSKEIVQVKFREGTDITSPGLLLPPDLQNRVLRINKRFALPKEKLDKMRIQGSARARKMLPNLNLWFTVTLKQNTDAAAFIAELRRVPSVETAEPAPLPPPPPAITPDFTASQGYLDAAPGGINTRYSWTIPGGNGSRVKVYDVEYSWNQAHEDLTKARGVPLLLSSGDSAVDPFTDNNHGTAVLGELIANNDSKGVTGISWAANIGLAPANTRDQGYDPANAILLAVSDGSAGDIILIEQQAGVCNSPGYGPIEWMSSVFDAIQTAVANGFVVVEAAGNGNVNLDESACGSTFRRTVRDSGAIIVGAGQTPASGSDRQRESYSTYGCRVDVQAWGSGVMTTGYGSYRNPDDLANPNFWYTNGFGGTSSASPIVAGAAANLQSIALQEFGIPLSPAHIRALLVGSGSAQLGETSQHIGPRPNLERAVSQLFSAGTGAALDIYLLVDLSGSFADDLQAFKAEASSIIADIKAAHPNTRFGLGKFEDYPIPPFGSAEAGDKAYERLVDLTFDTSLVLSTINGLFTRYGADGPQSQLAALLQAATGAGQDLAGSGYPGASIPPCQQASFRDEATKLFILWTDAAFHQPGDPGLIPYPGPTFNQTVDAIISLDPPKVIGISSGGGGLSDLQNIATATGSVAPGSGVDCNGDGVIDIQKGQPLVCGITFSGAGIRDAIVSLVEVATPITVNVDIKPGSDLNCIQPRNEGRVAVAVLGNTVDVAKINPAAISVDDDTNPNTAGVAPERWALSDVDHDRKPDLVMHFSTAAMRTAGLLADGKMLFVTGELLSGKAIVGSDQIFLAGGPHCH